MIADIHKAGLLVIRDGCVLLCQKKRSTSLLILPGGKLEPGESSEQCIIREVREELGDVTVRALEFIGLYVDAAAGDPGKTVHVDLYRGELDGEPHPQAEIGEIVWFGKDDDYAMLAPSLRNKIFPDLIARGILTWSSSPSAAG